MKAWLTGSWERPERLLVVAWDVHGGGESGTGVKSGEAWEVSEWFRTSCNTCA